MIMSKINGRVTMTCKEDAVVKLYELADMIVKVPRKEMTEIVYFLGMMDSIRMMLSELIGGDWNGKELNCGDKAYIIKDNEIIRKEK